MAGCGLELAEFPWNTIVPHTERLHPVLSCDRADPHRLLLQPIMSLSMSVSAHTSSGDVIRYPEYWHGSTVIILVHSAIYISNYMTRKCLVRKFSCYLKISPGVAGGQWTYQDDG